MLICKNSRGRLLSKADYDNLDFDPTELSVSTFRQYNWKCNKFVTDSYAKGAKVGLSIGRELGDQAVAGKGYPAKYDLELGKYIWPPRANQLADRDLNLRSLTNAKILRKFNDPFANPEIGDILAFPHFDGGIGHSALYLGNKLLLSAKETGIEIGTEEYEKDAHYRYS